MKAEGVSICVASVAGERGEAQTDPMELKDLISIEYGTKARNKPKRNMQHDINRLQ
jgi:hypothetical protein